MKLAVSNIAWDAPEQTEVLGLLSEFAIAGVELAPTKLWPNWAGATPAAAEAARERFAARGFVVPALQSILFGRPELSVFGDAKPLIAHVAEVAALAGALGAAVMVFGSPKNRLRGTLSPDEAMARAVPVFRAIGDACAAVGTCLGIEANPAQYGGDFLLTWREAAELVALVEHPGIALHLDTACTAMAGDDPVEAVRAVGRHIRHFHVSAPWLGPVGDDANPGTIDHAAVAAALRAVGYSGVVSIEMRRAEPVVDNLRRAVTFTRSHYG